MLDLNQNNVSVAEPWVVPGVTDPPSAAGTPDSYRQRPFDIAGLLAGGPSKSLPLPLGKPT